MSTKKTKKLVLKEPQCGSVAMLQVRLRVSVKSLPKDRA